MADDRATADPEPAMASKLSLAHAIDPTPNVDRKLWTQAACRPCQEKR